MQVLDPEFVSSVALGRQAPAVSREGTSQLPDQGAPDQGAAMGRFPSVASNKLATSIIPAAVTPSLYVTDTVCVGHMYPTIALP